MEIELNSLPLFPVIAIDGMIVAEDKVVSWNELEQFIAAT